MYGGVGGIQLTFKLHIQALEVLSKGRRFVCDHLLCAVNAGGSLAASYGFVVPFKRILQGRLPSQLRTGLQGRNVGGVKRRQGFFYPRQQLQQLQLFQVFLQFRCQFRRLNRPVHLRQDFIRIDLCAGFLCEPARLTELVHRPDVIPIGRVDLQAGVFDLKALPDQGGPRLDFTLPLNREPRSPEFA